uniref:PDZ domain-containing protein n=1 Tax=Zooxanthella nutricula TaxID=1333877 RepID=A0A6U8VKC8_9DINO
MGNAGCCSCEDDTGVRPDESRRPKPGSRPRQPNEVVITVDRSTGEGLGIDATPDVRKGDLEIKNITVGGLVERWNASQPNGKLVVKPGMRVIEVNGRHSSPKQLIAACRETEMLRITLLPAECAGD